MFFVFLPGDPYILKLGETGENGASDPDAELPLWGVDDSDFDCAGRQGGDFLEKTVLHADEHHIASAEHYIAVEVLSDVQVALHDALEGLLVQPAVFLLQLGGLEEGLGGLEPLAADHHFVAVGQGELPCEQIVTSRTAPCSLRSA